MTLQGLIAAFRRQANDKAQPYFWSDEEVTDYLNAAQVEAAIRGRLILEVADVDMCRIPVLPDVDVYTLNPLVYELDHIAFIAAGSTARTPLSLVSTLVLDELCNGESWRERKGEPKYAVQADKWVRLVPTPEVAGTIVIEAYRLPKTMVLADQVTEMPEISPAHHEHLIDWALHKAFSVPDTEAFDPKRADESERDFTDYFGIRPDSDLRRITRQDVQHRVEAFWV